MRLGEQIVILHRRLLAIVRDDEVCRRLMTTPGVGPVVALTYRATVDVPARFRKSKAVGAVFGPTCCKYAANAGSVESADQQDSLRRIPTAHLSGRARGVGVWHRSQSFCLNIHRELFDWVRLIALLAGEPRPTSAV